jgi:hypothetical protein
MPADDVTVLVVYTAIDYTLTIDYEYEDTTTAAASHVETLNVGNPYSVVSPVIPGYTASQTTVSGTMPADDVTVLVVYTAIDYTLTINYEFGDGSPAAPPYVDAAMNVGDAYDVLSPVIPGYTADKLNVAGIMPAADVTELVVYTAIDYTLTINYVYEDLITVAAPPHVETLNAGNPYSVDSPGIPGYTPDQATVADIMPAAHVTVLVVYTEKPFDVELSTYTVDPGQDRIRLGLVDSNGVFVSGLSTDSTDWNVTPHTGVSGNYNIEMVGVDTHSQWNYYIIVVDIPFGVDKLNITVKYMGITITP